VSGKSSESSTHCTAANVNTVSYAVPVFTFVVMRPEYGGPFISIASWLAARIVPVICAVTEGEFVTVELMVAVPVPLSVFEGLVVTDAVILCVMVPVTVCVAVPVSDAVLVIVADTVAVPVAAEVGVEEIVCVGVPLIV